MLADDLVLALAMWTLANSHQVNIYTEEGKKISANLLNYIYFFWGAPNDLELAVAMKN